MLPEILLKALLIVLSALIGALSVFFVKLNHHKLCAIISVSAGALLGAAVFVIIPEVSSLISIYQIIISAGTGYLLFWGISKYYFHVCPACSASHFDEQTTKKFSEIVLTLITALSFHSFMDGLALTSGNIHSHSDGNSIFAAILTHKFPEGLALAALMLGANYSRKKILLYVVLIQSTTIFGAVTGYFLLQSGVSSVFLGLIMAHVAGGFVYLALHAILGEMLKNHKLLVLSSFGGGMLLIYLVHLLVH